MNASEKLSALGHPGYGEAFAQRCLDRMEGQPTSLRHAIDCELADAPIPAHDDPEFYCYGQKCLDQFDCSPLRCYDEERERLSAQQVNVCRCPDRLDLTMDEYGTHMAHCSCVCHEPPRGEARGTGFSSVPVTSVTRPFVCTPCESKTGAQRVRCDSCNCRPRVDEAIHCFEDGRAYHYCEDCWAP